MKSKENNPINKGEGELIMASSVISKNEVMGASKPKNKAKANLSQQNSAISKDMPQ